MSKIARFAACMLLVALALGSCMIDLLTDTYSVFYDENGAASGTVPVDSTNYEPDQTVTVLGNPGTLALDHYAFAGWNTSDDGSGTLYTAGQTFAMGEADVTLYAAWALNDYLVVFDANGGTGSMTSQPIPYESSAALTPNAFNRAYNSFAGWGTSPGGPVVYADGASYTMNTVGTTLYAQWTAATYNVSFDANSGTGTMAPQSISYGSSAALTANTFSYTGYVFIGWAETALGAVVYEDGESLTMSTEGATLYAVWVSVAELVASVPANTDCYGMSVAVDGDYAIIGASNRTEGGELNCGAAYIYHRTAANIWGEECKISSNASSPAYGNFGYSVAISGDLAIVGAPNETYFEEGSAGIAYIFIRGSGNTWTLDSAVYPPSVNSAEYFGSSVGISGEYAIVGAWGESVGGANRGEAYIFRRTGETTWGEDAILGSGSAAGDWFGCAVGISGDYAVVGAHNKDSGTGAAYIFHRTGVDPNPNVWDAGVQLDTDPFEVKPFTHFGHSVAIDGNYVVVGVNVMVGAAYVYHCPDLGVNSWDSGVRIEATVPVDGDGFGTAVSIDGDVIVVGAPESGGRGAAFLFNRTGTNAWDSGLKIVASNPGAGDFFGGSVGVSGVYAIVGARNEDTGENDAGMTYVFTGF